MKTTLLLATLSLTFCATAQKKLSYKSDYFDVKLRYNTLPALTELNQAKNYTISVADADNATVSFGNATMHPEIETTSYIEGMRHVEGASDFSIVVTTQKVRRTKLESHSTTSATTPAITTASYHINYDITYRLVITDNKTATVLMDSVFRSSGFTNYPSEYGKQAPTSEVALQKMYNAEQSANFDRMVSHLSVKNFAQIELKKQLANTITGSWANLNLTFNVIKTKDPYFAKLDSAQIFIESAFKIMNKNHLNGVKINWHIEEVQRLLAQSHTIYNAYFVSAEVAQLEDVELKDKFLNSLVVNIYYLDVMLGKYDEAKQLLYASKNVDQLEADKKQTLANEKTVSGAFGMLKQSSGQKMHDYLAVMESALMHESKYHEKHKAYYHFY